MYGAVIFIGGVPSPPRGDVRGRRAIAEDVKQKLTPPPPQRPQRPDAERP